MQRSISNCARTPVRTVAMTAIRTQSILALIQSEAVPCVTIVPATMNAALIHNVMMEDHRPQTYVRRRVRAMHIASMLRPARPGAVPTPIATTTTPEPRIDVIIPELVPHSVITYKPVPPAIQTRIATTSIREPSTRAETRTRAAPPASTATSCARTMRIATTAIRTPAMLAQYRGPAARNRAAISRARSHAPVTRSAMTTNL